MTWDDVEIEDEDDQFENPNIDFNQPNNDTNKNNDFKLLDLGQRQRPQLNLMQNKEPEIKENNESELHLGCNTTEDCDPCKSRLKVFKNALRMDFQNKFMNNWDDGQVFLYFENKDPDEGILYKKISGTFKKLFEKKERLGEGTVGMVNRYVKKETGESFAVKTMKTRDEELTYQIKEEFRFMKELKHENIIKCYELYIDPDHARIYLVMEYLKGVEMFEYIQKIDHYKEEDAKNLFSKLLNGIEYLHSKGVVHRDLKPNNIMVTKDGKILKILDFNVAKFYKNYKNYNSLSKKNYEMTTYTGTIAFTAPEVFTSDHYTEEVDMWSAGCILYTMLAGFMPFTSEYVADLIESIKKCDIDLKSPPWDSVSIEGKN